MLLTDVLRKEWGFDGYVVADDAALNFMISDHHYVKNNLEALLVSFKNGVNMDFGDERWSGPLVFWQQLPALAQGKITEDDIRNNVKPILKARFLLGEFDPEEMNPYNKIGMDVVQSAAHREAAIEAAMMGFVLLKNADNLLPLKPNAKTVAVGACLAEIIVVYYNSDVTAVCHVADLMLLLINCRLSDRWPMTRISCLVIIHRQLRGSLL